MTQPTILICGNYGAGNFGDELILTSLLKTTKELHPQKIIITSGDTRETASTHGITAIRFFPSSVLSWAKSLLTLSFFRSIYYLYQSDIVLFGGGCLFNEKEPNSIPIWYSQFQWFRRLKKKTIIIGQSFGSFASSETIQKIKELTVYCEKIFVRDDSSKQTLLALAPCDIEVMLDPALWLKKEDFSTTSSGKKSYALFILRDWITIDRDLLQEKITKLSKYLFEKYKLPSRILVLQQGCTADKQISYDLQRKIQPYSDAPIEIWSTIDEMVQTYNDAALIVSMRLHGGILGLILGKPTLFLDYDDKVGNLLADLKLENLLVNPNDDQFESKADSLLSAASESILDTFHEAIQKSSPKSLFQNYLTKIINQLK